MEKVEKLNIEETLKEIEKLTNEMSSENLPIDEVYEKYKKGVGLVDSCKKQLEKMKEEIRRIDEGEDGMKDE